MKLLLPIIVQKNIKDHKTGKFVFYLSAFLLPFTIMLIAFIALKIYPFGNAQAMVQDAWHQYYPFLLELYRKVKSGESLLYDWRIGLGSGFIPLLAYYLTSPLNLLIFLFPASLLREVFALLILVKIGFAGAFCAYALYKFSHKKEYGIIIFSTLYALCSWACCYYCHIIWLDTFAVFPLIVTGIRMLVKEKKCRLYTISLAFAIFANYYMGLLICIFTVIYFFAQCFLNQNTMKELWNNLKSIMISSVIAILISAVVTFPVIMTMSMQSSIADNQSTAQWRFARGWIESLANTFAFREIDIATSLPNLYCGVICILFLFAFYRLPNISKREKLIHTALLLFFYAGINIDALSYLLNGFHTPVGMPYRFSFMFSFLLIVSAYQVYSNIELLKITDWLFMCIAGIVYFLAVAVEEIVNETDFQTLLLENMSVIAAYLILTFPALRRKFNRKEFTLLLAFIVELELLPTVMAGTKSIGVTDRTSYPDSYDEIQKILHDIIAVEGENSFYRVELTTPYTNNSPVLYDYPGISVFSSSANSNIIRLFQNLGMGSSQNRYLYYNSTPIANMFLNLKYLIERESEVVNKEYLTAVQQVNEVALYQNTAYLPVGFMVDSQMADLQLNGETPFENQNIFLKAAAGIDENVFTALDIIHVEHEMLDVLRYGYGVYTYEYKPAEDTSILDPKAEAATGIFRYNYEMPKDGCAYVYMDLNDSRSVSVKYQDTVNTYDLTQAHFFPAGTYQQGDLFSISSEVEAETSGNLQIYVSILEEEIFDKAYEILRDEPLHVTELTAQGLAGQISVKENGLLYTSIPYEKGWKIYVDGQETNITPIADAFIGVMLPQGEHMIELKYAPTYMYTAIFLSLTGITLLIICVIYENQKNKQTSTAPKGSAHNPTLNL